MASYEMVVLQQQQTAAVISICTLTGIGTNASLVTSGFSYKVFLQGLPDVWSSARISP
jgi:hypothetical protein